MKIGSIFPQAVKYFAIWVIVNGLGSAAAFSQDLKTNCRLTPSSSDKSAVLSLSSLQGKKVSFRILDNAGHTILKDEVAGKENYASILNFSKLAEGEYTFSYTVEGIERSSKMIVTSQHVEVVSPHKLKSFYSPMHHKVSERKLDVFVDNETNETLKVNLFDKKGHLVFSGRYFNEEQSYVKRFNLGSLESGEYTLSILKGKSTFNGSIILE